jgi:hypothetical protein
MLSSLQKFISQVGHTRQQLSGDIQLVIPDIAITELDQAIKDDDLLHTLEGTMSEWASVLASAVQAQSQKGLVGSSPLAEIEFWRERNSALSSLYEQLNLPQARKIMAVVEAGSGDHNLMQSFKAQFTELTKLCVEARDNVKFLTTLERHFKNITNGPLGAGQKSLFVISIRVALPIYCLLSCASFCFAISHLYAFDRKHLGHTTSYDERAAHGLGHQPPLQRRRTDGQPLRWHSQRNRQPRGDGD